jgi:HEAT repeat protein
LVNLIETADREEVDHLAKSDRAGLRLLACEVVSVLELKECVDLIVPLIQDTHPDVRAAALITVGLLHIGGKGIQPLIEPLTSDPNPSVAIAASYAMMLQDPSKGQYYLRPWLSHENQRIRLLAAGALSQSGPYGYPLTLEMFHETKDPYVRINLALSLITQNKERELAQEALYQGITTIKEKWMMEEGMFSYLAPSRAKHRMGIANYPEALNQMVRLDVLNKLAILNHPKAKEAIKNFLQEKTWGVSGSASALLLTEGDDAAVDIVKGLLDDPTEKIRIQAALILSLWGGDQQSLEVLKKAYPGATRELKEQILEGVGRVGDPSTLPFLVDRLKEPSQHLRLIAAASLLQTLYQ